MIPLEDNVLAYVREKRTVSPYAIMQRFPCQEVRRVRKVIRTLVERGEIGYTIDWNIQYNEKEA